LKKFLKKRVERVVIPFLFWVFILILVEIIFFNNFGLNYFLDIFLAS
jgi:fucose 4-O-acetylase-like acetyltransferase